MRGAGAQHQAGLCGIAQTIDTDPDSVWVFVNDQLNIHPIGSVVRLIYRKRYSTDTDRVGRRPETGVLQSI